MAGRVGSARMGMWWHDVRDSMWFVPSAIVLLASALAMVLLRIDARLSADDTAAFYLFGGSPEGAQELLSVVAGSLITVVAVAFSVTMLAIQQAATQYTPRVLRNYMRDRGNQVVLGTYVGTFSYSLLVLREVRTGAGSAEPFVPAASTFGAFALALASVGMLVYFMHHAAQTLQVSHVLGAIRDDLDRECARLFPEAFGEASCDPPPYGELLAGCQDDQRGILVEVRAEAEGYLGRIDLAALERAVPSDARLVIVPARIGAWMQREDVLARIWSDAQAEPQRVREAFALSRHRTVEQDAMFGLRQLADIALKALSPSVNDPTTAEEALQHLGGALGVMVRRDLPSPDRRRGSTRWLFNVPGFRDYLREALGQARRAAASHPHVLGTLLGVLTGLAERAPSPERAGPVRELVHEILGTLPGDLTGSEMQDLRRQGERALAALREAEPSRRP